MMQRIKLMLRSMWFWFCRNLLLEKPILNPKPYLRAIHFFFSHKKEKYLLDHIVSVQVIGGGQDGPVLEIETRRPGLLIGVKGKNINELKKSIEHDLGHTIQIKVKECMLWSDCWRD